MTPPRLAFVGFGEAAEAFATGFDPAIAGASAFDIDPGGRPAARAARCGVRLVPDRAEALARAEAVFCLVTADRAVEAAREAAAVLARGCLWLDGNSCSPGAKRRAAEAIAAAGGRYVDVAIMAPVHPRLHRTPLLLGGPHAAAALALVTALGMQAEVASDRVGDAAAIKMIRSVMVKGMEALTAECLLAARRAGVDAPVLASLQASNPGTDWARQAAYNLDRMQVHGLRRAAEMHEVAATLDELGLPAELSRASAAWQARIGALGLPGGIDDATHSADAVLSRL